MHVMITNCSCVGGYLDAAALWGCNALGFARLGVGSCFGLEVEQNRLRREVGWGVVADETILIWGWDLA